MTVGLGDPTARLRDADVATLIDALHARAEEIRQEELSRAEGRWEALSDEDRVRLDALTQNIVGALLGEPMARLQARAPGDAASLRSARYIFGLEG